MTTSDTDEGGQTLLIRLGGVAILVGFAIHIVANVFIKQMPPDDPSLVELRTYLATEAGNWAIVHGMRYVAIVCLAVFAAALFTRTCCLRSTPPVGWGMIGFLGASLMLANLLITNGIEMFVFLDADLVATDAGVFWGLFGITRVLFTAEVVASALFIGGFSVAGRLSSTLPVWLSAIGLVSATFGLLSGVFIVSIVTGGRAAFIIEIASLSGLLWFVCAGFYLLIRGAVVENQSS